jgi:lon-related putative ATP-dependent protease
VKWLDEQRNMLFNKLSEKVRSQGFLIRPTPMGIFAAPAVDNKPMDQDTFDALPEEQRKKIIDQQNELQEELKNAVQPLGELEKQASKRLQQLEMDAALFSLNPLVEYLLEKYEEIPEVIAYLEAVKADILGSLGQFVQGDKSETKMPQGLVPVNNAAQKKYKVNVLVDNANQTGAPVVVEHNPTYINLFGKVEKESSMGTMFTDFTLIRPGSLHRANGGYLIIPIEDLLRNGFSYESLKRALQDNRIEIEEIGEKLGFITTKGLKPESIPLNVQVILIGETRIYHLLYEYDKNFRELFKVKAEFGTSMDRTEENEVAYLSFLAKVSESEQMPPFDREAMAKMIEYGTRLAGNRDKLSTAFREIADVAREAGFYSRGNGAIGGSDVLKAIEERTYRSNLMQEKINDAIEEETYFIAIGGEKIGQVNGIAVLSLGDIAFGRPNRITAITAVGRKGVIDIEREAELGGSLHTKGVMILTGFLNRLFAGKRPLALFASLTFEQSYGRIDGDSASSTELYALLSSLSGLPIRQGIAVTGSVNQMGEIQPVGGINEKIEGYFEVCKRLGLNGEQGVMIPAANQRHLMLKEEVLEAVQENQFRIWAVHSVEEGIELLTGVPAGVAGEDGSFPEGTVYHRVEERLAAFSEKLKASSASAKT